VLKVPKVLKVLLVHSRPFRDHREHRVHRVPKVHRVMLVPPAQFPVLRDRKVQLVHKVLLDLKVTLVLLVHRGQLDHKDHRGHKVHRDRRGRRATRVPLVFRLAVIPRRIRRCCGLMSLTPVLQFPLALLTQRVI